MILVIITVITIIIVIIMYIVILDERMPNVNASSADNI